MKLTKLLTVALFTITLAACGGGGSSDSTSVAPGTTPLDDNNPSTENGTYRVIELEYYFTNGEYFTSNNLDSFQGTIVVNIAADTMQSEMEWHDDVYGDYYDFDIDSYSNPTLDPGTTYDAYYYQLVDDYNITFFYDNMCVDGLCADSVLKIRKISDSTAPISLGRVSPAPSTSGGAFPFLVLPQ